MTTDETAATGWTARPGPCRSTPASAHHARMYDYLLGGKDNYARRPGRPPTRRSRALAGPGLRRGGANPGVPRPRRPATLAADAGIRQFLDLGTGIPDGGQPPRGGAGDRTPRPGSSTSTTTPIVLAHARAAARQQRGKAPPSTSRRTCATHRQHPRPGRPAAGLQQAGSRSPWLAIPAGDPRPPTTRTRFVATLLDAVAVRQLPSPSLTPSSDFPRPGKRQEGIGDSWNGRVQQQFTFRSRDQVAQFFAGTGPDRPPA